MKKYLQKTNPLVIFFLVILFSSVISCIYVWFHTQERLSMDFLKQDMTQYRFTSTSDKVTITDLPNEMVAEWQEQEEHFYISTFDSSVSKAPDTSANEYAKIPSGSKKLQIDASIAGTRNDIAAEPYSVSFMVITYSNDGKENSVTEDIVLNSAFEGRGRMHSLVVPISKETTGYRVLLRVSIPSGKSHSGYLKITKFFVHFR